MQSPGTLTQLILLKPLGKGLFSHFKENNSYQLKKKKKQAWNFYFRLLEE